MLNKLQFNNMVISNKKGIQQSRIQTINKLVHKIRKLKTLLEKRPEDNKCKERVRKSAETMEQLKKFKRVDIMKKVLLMEKHPAAVITNGLSTPEEMAVALLAMNKIMEGLIKRFKTELKLDDATNSTWRDELMENSKRRQKIERTEEKKRKRIAVKEQKAIARKRQEWLVQNCPEGEREEEPKDSEVNISTMSGWKIEEIEEPVLKKIIEIGESAPVKVSQQLKRPQNENKTKRVRKESTGKKQKIETKSQEINKFVENHSSEEEQNSRPSLALHENDEEEHSNHSLVSDENGAESATETHVVDPFFVTETGENYLSTAVASRVHCQDGYNELDDQEDRHLIKLNGSKKHTNFRDRNQQQQSDRYPQKQNNWNNGQYPQRQNKWNDDKYTQKQNKWNDDKYPQKQNNWNKQNDWKKTNEREPRQQSNREQFSNSLNQKPEQKLHPSWAAKQKLKPVITGFQGKKITFGDEGNVQVTNGSTIKNSRKDQPAQHASVDSLHPSWAAKQKQKPVITAFQGKKISFDNDE